MGYSKQDVLLYVTDAWLKAIDSGQFVGATFLDLGKAFDWLYNSWHFVAKLCSMSHLGRCLCEDEKISAWYVHRFQQVFAQNALSSKGSVTVGVPQGSILRPLLFSIICVNDLPSSITTVYVCNYLAKTI